MSTPEPKTTRTACATHPDAAADFTCSACRRAFCAACRRVHENGTEVCPMCAGGEMLQVTGFCPQCKVDSTDETPGDVSTMNGIGRKFYGGAEPCPRCGSVIRTLWWTVVEIPIVPRGSYRFKTISDGVGNARFWARRTRLHWPQVFVTWIVGLAIGAAAITAIVLYDQSKKHH